MTESENSARDFLPAPGSVDCDFIMDPVYLGAFRVDTDFKRDSSTDTVFLLLFTGELLAKWLFNRARLPLRYIST